MIRSDRKFTTVSTLALIGTAGLAAAAAPALAHDLPPNGRAGECYAEVIYPAVYRTVTERVPGPPIVSYRDTPPVYGHGSKQVLVTPERIDREVIPAVYKTMPRWTEVPGPNRWERTTPVYRTMRERVQVSPGHLEWRRTGSRHGYSDGDGYGISVRPTGEVMCRVWVPGRYAYVAHRVLVSPGHAYRVPGPPRHVVCYQQVLVTPARTIEHRIPATYRTVATTYVIRPPGHERVVSPGPVRTISHQVVATPAHKGWTRIVCKTPAYRPPVHRRPVYHPPVYGRPVYGHPVYGRPADHPAPSGYGAAPGPGYGGQGASYGGGQPYRPDEILAPTPSFPQTAARTRPGQGPYDVGHPSR